MNVEEFMQLEPSSEVTSGYLGVEYLQDTRSETETFEHPFHKFFSERVAFPLAAQGSLVCKRLHPDESAYPFNFQSNIYIKALNQNFLVGSFKEDYFIIAYNHGKLSFKQSPELMKFQIEGPPDDLWTVQSWVLDAATCELPSNVEVSNIKGQIHDLLTGFNKRLPLSRPNELRQMAERVAKQIETRKEEDIDSWAEELSKDLSKLSD